MDICPGERGTTDVIGVKSTERQCEVEKVGGWWTNWAIPHNQHAKCGHADQTVGARLGKRAGQDSSSPSIQIQGIGQELSHLLQCDSLALVYVLLKGRELRCYCCASHFSSPRRLPRGREREGIARAGGGRI